MSQTAVQPEEQAGKTVELYVVKTFWTVSPLS